jgi:predicted acetyltransferase
MKDNIFLVEPDMALRDQFSAMVCGYKNSDEADYFEIYKDALEDFDKYVLKLQNNSKGIDIPEDWVATHSFWLINEGSEVLGVLRVRTDNENEFVRSYAGNIGYDISPLHRQKGYGKTILTLGLEKAKVLGLDKALVTCNYDNVGSIKIIESNGGVFESEAFCQSKNTLLRRYWFEI